MHDAEVSVKALCCRGGKGRERVDEVGHIYLLYMLVYYLHDSVGSCCYLGQIVFA